jgi:hypothetical protein
VPRSRHAVAMKFMAVAFQSDKFNLGAAEIDADSESIRGSAGWVRHGDEILSQNLARPVVRCTARCDLNPCNRSMPCGWLGGEQATLLLGERRGICA